MAVCSTNKWCSKYLTNLTGSDVTQQHLNLTFTTRVTLRSSMITVAQKYTIAFRVRRSPSFVLPVSRSRFPVSRSPLPVSRSPFAVRGCRFLVRRSPFAVHRYRFLVRRCWFLVRRSPFAVAGFWFAVRRSRLPVSGSPFAGFWFAVCRSRLISRFSVSDLDTGPAGRSVR